MTPTTFGTVGHDSVPGVTGLRGIPRELVMRHTNHQTASYLASFGALSIGLIWSGTLIHHLQTSDQRIPQVALLAADFGGRKVL